MFAERLNKLRDRLAENHIDVAIITDDVIIH